MQDRKGIILAGGTGTRLYPLTISVSKQLMPVYDKPMIYYPLSALMLADIREILVITSPRDLPLFRNLLGDGSRIGLQFTYVEQPRPEGIAQALILAEDFLSGDPSALILGDNLFYGHNLATPLQAASGRATGATIFGYRVANPGAYGVVEVSPEGKALTIEEKPQHPRSRYAIPGIYFFDAHAPAYARRLKPSPRGELEITDLAGVYLARRELNVELLGRGIAWLDTGTHENLLDASQFVQVIERRQGLKIACPEEIAFRKQWIGPRALRECVEALGESSYRQYLEDLLLESS
jgi:glucose-1-phosphate thymidylyltransferase